MKILSSKCTYSRFHWSAIPTDVIIVQLHQARQTVPIRHRLRRMERKRDRRCSSPSTQRDEEGPVGHATRQDPESLREPFEFVSIYSCNRFSLDCVLLVTHDMELRPNIGSDRSWVWKVAADFSESPPTPETLAIRFANSDSTRILFLP